MYIDFDRKNNKEGSKFKVGGNVRISYKGNKKVIKRKGDKLYVKWKG